MPKPRVLVAGGVNVDTTFRLKSFPGVGETVFASDCCVAMGGKGLNQALAVQRAGTPAAIIGAVGDDAESELIRSFLEQESITSYLQCLEGVSTGRAVIYVDANADNMIVVNPGANALVDALAVEDLGDVFSTLDAVIANGETSMDLVEGLFKQARSAGIKTVLNPSPMPEHVAELLGLTDLLIVNQHEAREVFNSTGNLQDLIDDLGATGPAEIVMTLGSMGSYIACSGELVKVPAVPVEAVDPTAAGDTYLGYYVAARCSGNLPRVAGGIAADAAAQCVLTLGAADSIPIRTLT